MYSFPNFEPVHCSMTGSTCCFLSCIQVSQEKSKVVWYFHLFKIVSQFVVIHTVKGFIILNESEVGVFLEFLCLSYDLISQSVQLLSHVRLFATPRTAARQASLSIANSWSLLTLMPIELVMPSNSYLRLLIFLLAFLIPACASSSLEFDMMYPAYKLYKQGDNIQPWRTPFPIWNHSGKWYTIKVSERPSLVVQW